jgi:polyvinyl alcohol dehydrogenase (cytochrome)
MRVARAILPVALCALLLAPIARATCPPSCAIPGGSNPALDCQAEFAAQGLRLNYPAFDPAHPKAGKEVRCFDGDAGCDLDDAADHACVFDVDVCLRNDDPALPACTPADVTSVSVSGTLRDPELAALQSALSTLVPATSNVCTSGRTLTVPLKGPDAHGVFKPGKKKVSLKAATAAGTDSDTLKLRCMPRGWPSHGYDHRNTRTTPNETTLSPTNANALVLKWDLDLHALTGAAANGVTSTPTVGNGLVYVTSWNGLVVAARPQNGSVKWRYDTQSGNVMGVQSSATLTADGRVLVGDSRGVVHCLSATSGKLLWKSVIGDASIDHIWASPTVVGGRVYIGIASHNDNPCTHGRLVALDLDTGAVLWTLKLLPDRICTSDTSIACTSDADCGTGTCVEGRGAGVTATVATDPSGAFVYANTVGCFTFPSIGDEDSILKVDAATGGVVWKTRLDPPEQFGACANDGSIECRNSADCAFVTGPCVAPSFHHDFGFLNGPLVVHADDGLGGTRELVVSGSKDGSLYARDPSNGAEVWTRAVAPKPITPAFAGFGLFNGGVGFVANHFVAALNDFVPPLASPPEHLMAFNPVDGSTTWQDEIGASWGSIGAGGGLVVVGTNATNALYVYDATTGTRLVTLPVSDTVSSGASIVDGTIYVGYGIFGSTGGVRAFALPPPLKGY